jgi:hypothetical protein
VCSTCPAATSDRCTSGQCKCGSSDQCGFGQACVGAVCTCTPGSCAGCCLGDQCFLLGDQCTPEGLTCESDHSCRCKGCFEGPTCQPGTSTFACGAYGDPCNNCFGSPCVNGVCN